MELDREDHEESARRHPRTQSQQYMVNYPVPLNITVSLTNIGNHRTAKKRFVSSGNTHRVNNSQPKRECEDGIRKIYGLLLYFFSGGMVTIT